MTLKFYQYGADKLVATLELDEAHSSIIERINEPTRLSATLTSTTAPTLQLGARTTYKGVTYYVTKEPTVRKEHSKLYTIEAELETVIGLARHVILDNPVDKRSSFDYTATATEHIQLVVDSLNGKKLRKIPAWTRGKIRVPDKVKHIKYDGISAWDALQLIRQTYETDLHIDGTAIDLGIWSDKNNAIELAYGKGNGILSGLERIKHDDTPTPMSLYVTGTKRNMPTGRLTMQQLETLKVDEDGNILHGDSASGRIFSTDKTGQYISEFTHENGEQPLYTEATYTNEEIYPSHVSTIRSVTKVKDHFEVNSDFDYSKLRIDGEQMQVVFQTGNLAGRDFDAKYFSSTGRLAIVPKEEDDTTLPNDTLCPKVGDQYIVTGIKLPGKYIKEAQRRLTEEALHHLVKLQQQRYSYKAEIDPVYLHNNKTTIGNKLDVGQYVHLTDQQIAIGDPYIRIVGKRTYLDRPYTPEIELSNEVERLSLFDRLIRDTNGMLLDSKLILGRINTSSMALDNLTLTSTDLSERLKIAEESVQSHGQALGSQAELLASQAQLLADQVQRLTTQGESLSSQSQRLATAEQALTGKLDSGAFAQWQAGDLAKALASKQPAGSYALTSQLATSQQQAVAEAVKRAEELDKQIKVGGRNLFRKEYLTEDLPRFYKIPFDALQPRDGDNTYTLSLDYKISSDDKASSPRITCFYQGSGNIFWDSNIVRNGEWHHKEYTIQLKETDPSKYPIYGWFTDYGSNNGRTIDMVAVRNVKLERGTVATDWTPAPEDVEESISTVNTSLVSLASTLLDPTTGEIHKLTSQLESHKTATAQSFAELSNHPLTIDENGYWRIWNLKQQQYVTTQYQSRGRDGEDAGRYLGRAKRIHPDFNGNYLLETEDSWRTAKEGDYVYLVGDLSNRGGDKDTYYIVREHKGNTVWEVYNIKGDTPNLSLDEQYRLLADNKLVSELSLKGRDGQDGAKGDKGDTPNLSLDEQYRLVADGKLVSQQSLKGRDGEDGAKGADGKDGHTPVIKWSGTKLVIDDKAPVDLQGQRGDAGHTPELHVGEDDYLYIDNVRQRYIRGRQGEPGHSPKPDEVLSTDSFRQQLTSKVTSEVTTQVAPVSKRIDSVKKTADKTSTDLATANTKLEAVETKADNSLTGLNNLSGQVSRIEGEVQTATQGVSDLKTFETSATSQLSDLSNRSLTLDQKRDLGYLTNSLQVLRSAGNTLEGLALQRLIALSGNGKDISAYLASNALGAVLKAGITGFGTANEREQVEITHQGTGHIGNLYFAGDTINFRKDKHTDPYLSIGTEESTFIDTFISQARLDDTPVSVDTVTLSESSKVYERTVSVDNSGTRLTVVIDQLTVRLYNLAKARLLLDGEELASWQGSQQISEGGGFGGGFKTEYKPYKGRNLSYERVVKAGSHTLRLEIAGNMGSGDSGATVKGLQVRRRYNTGAQQSALTKSGLRLFASPDRYFDVDYRKMYTSYWPGVGNVVSTNPYLVRIVGGAKVDKLTADEVDAPGVPLCGASFNERGGQIKAFGKYVNQRGYSRAQAEYDNGMAAFKVYHSIGHTNYIPIVQVSGWASNDINWSLTPRVYNITSEYFVVRILTNNDNPTARAISYVAYKTE